MSKSIEEKPKVDSPENYHGFITAHKVFETPFQYGYGFLVELECGHVLEFADTTEKEKKINKILCPQCRAESKNMQPEEAFYKQILRYRRVQIGKEGKMKCP